MSDCLYTLSGRPVVSINLWQIFQKLHIYHANLIDIKKIGGIGILWMLIYLYKNGISPSEFNGEFTYVICIVL